MYLPNSSFRTLDCKMIKYKDRRDVIKKTNHRRKYKASGCSINIKSKRCLFEFNFSNYTFTDIWLLVSKSLLKLRIEKIEIDIARIINSKATKLLIIGGCQFECWINFQVPVLPTAYRRRFWVKAKNWTTAIKPMNTLNIRCRNMAGKFDSARAWPARIAHPTQSGSR